jgi:hypothetical protein
MPDYQFSLRLDAVDRDPAQVRVWIDDQLHEDFSSERELPLEHDGGSCWSAQFSANSGAFIYRIGICAERGTRWALSFRDLGDDVELLFDSDELIMSKEWLVGTCENGLRRPRLIVGRTSDVIAIR